MAKSARCTELRHEDSLRSAYLHYAWLQVAHCVAPSCSWTTCPPLACPAGRLRLGRGGRLRRAAAAGRAAPPPDPTVYTHTHTGTGTHTHTQAHAGIRVGYEACLQLCTVTSALRISRYSCPLWAAQLGWGDILCCSGGPARQRAAQGLYCAVGVSSLYLGGVDELAFLHNFLGEEWHVGVCCEGLDSHPARAAIDSMTLLPLGCPPSAV